MTVEYPLFEPPKNGKRGAAIRTLGLLKIADRYTGDLIELVGVRPAAYVGRLREMGHVISGDGDAVPYRYEYSIERIEVTEELKAAYYETPHWRAMRATRKAFDGFQCASCKSQGDLQVHHWRYELFAEQQCDLMTLCGACHKRTHEYQHVQCHFPHFVSPDIADRIMSRDLIQLETT